MDVFVSRYGHEENTWDIGCIFLPNVRCIVFRSESSTHFFPYILARASIFWKSNYLNIVPLLSRKSSSAIMMSHVHRSTECLLPTTLLMSGTSPAQSSAAFALPAQTAPIIWGMANIHHRPARCQTSQAGVGWTGWGDGLPNSTKSRMLWGKTPLLWDSCHWCFMWIHINNLRMCSW